jgi:toxin FitB
LSYLLDTNVISEVRKGQRCDPYVASWFASLDESQIFLSVLTVGEIRSGIERVRAKEPARAAALGRWLDELEGSYTDRILAIDRAVADAWGRMTAIRSLATVDALMAATAKVHHMRLVTRNVSDVAGLGVPVLNPFDAAGS